MKNSIIKEIIKKEILNILKEEEGEKLKSEVTILKKYLEGAGKTALSQINNPEELKSVLNIIWNGMNDAFRENNAIANSLKKIIDTKLK